MTSGLILMTCLHPLPCVLSGQWGCGVYEQLELWKISFLYLPVFVPRNRRSILVSSEMRNIHTVFRFNIHTMTPNIMLGCADILRIKWLMSFHMKPFKQCFHKGHILCSPSATSPRHDLQFFFLGGSLQVEVCWKQILNSWRKTAEIILGASCHSRSTLLPHNIQNTPAEIFYIFIFYRADLSIDLNLTLQ